MMGSSSTVSGAGNAARAEGAAAVTTIAAAVATAEGVVTVTAAATEVVTATEVLLGALLNLLRRIAFCSRSIVGDIWECAEEEASAAASLSSSGEWREGNVIRSADPEPSLPSSSSMFNASLVGEGVAFVVAAAVAGVAVVDDVATVILVVVVVVVTVSLRG